MQESPLQLHRKSSRHESVVLGNFGASEDVKIGTGSRSFLSEDAALEHLAKILVDAYFKQKRYDRTKQPQ